MLHVGDEVADAVIERHLPARRAAAQVVGPLPGGLQPGDHHGRALRVLQCTELGLQRQPKVLGGRKQVLRHGAALQLLGAPEHVPAEVGDQLRESRLGVELGVLEPGGVQPEVGGDGEESDAGGCLRQMCPVECGHLPPLRVEVRLGQHAGGVRADPHGLAQETDLRLGVLLRGVGDQEHGIRRRQRGKRGEGMGRVEPADPGGVHQGQPAGEELAREEDFRGRQPVPVAGIAVFGHVAGQILDRHLAALELGFAAGVLTAVAGDHDPGGGRISMPDHSGNGGSDVVINGTDGGVDERVDQFALALLELADHDDADGRVEHAPPGLLQPPAQIRPIGVRRQYDALLHEFDQLSHTCLLLRASFKHRPARQELPPFLPGRLCAAKSGSMISRPRLRCLPRPRCPLRRRCPRRSWSCR